MYPRNYFAGRYFPPLFFPPVAFIIVIGTDGPGGAPRGVLVETPDPKVLRDLIREDEEILAIITIYTEHVWHR